MNKKDVMKILDLSSFVAIIVATVLVVIFEFSGSALVVFYSMALYSAGFLLATVFFSIKTYDVFKREKSSKLKTNSSNYDEPKSEEEPNVEVVDEIANTKSQKVSVIVKLILSLIAFVFTFTITILF